MIRRWFVVLYDAEFKMVIKRTFLSSMDQHMLNGEISAISTDIGFTFFEQISPFLECMVCVGKDLLSTEVARFNEVTDVNVPIEAFVAHMTGVLSSVLLAVRRCLFVRWRKGYRCINFG